MAAGAAGAVAGGVVEIAAGAVVSGAGGDCWAMASELESVTASADMPASLGDSLAIVMC